MGTVYLVEMIAVVVGFDVVLVSVTCVCSRTDNRLASLAGLSAHFALRAAPPRLASSGGGDWNRSGRSTNRPARVVAGCCDLTEMGSGVAITRGAASAMMLCFSILLLVPCRHVTTWL